MAQDWETTEDIQQMFEAAGLPITRSALERRLERRRREQLLPDNADPQSHRKGLRGSETRHPLGTAAQALEIERLLRTRKRRFKEVGWDLWWRGFQVGDRHGLRWLRVVARYGDRLLRNIRREADLHSQLESNSTIFDGIDDLGSNHTLANKLKRRIGSVHLSATLGVVVGSVLGDFDLNLDEQDQRNIEAAFDIAQAKTDQALGQKMNQAEVIPLLLSMLSQLAQGITLSEIAMYPKAELEQARDNVQQAMEIAKNMHAATTPIYGAAAFGLRQAAWISDNSSRTEKIVYVLAFAGLRRRTNFLSPQSKISDLHAASKVALAISKQLQEVRNRPEFVDVLSNKELKQGLRTKDANWQLSRKIEGARIQHSNSTAGPDDVPSEVEYDGNPSSAQSDKA